ncbi:Crp/Fnr family transcriptional regulator [Brevibacillus humidisoli]|uniref:Crp/Fnr family transcriptional regulator n=1 Tax=Brevibacillus humidisoli TaxID=2895522 RepID=UPI001E62CD48|nr:Crp/Fnr family transcriptional regulator [Brevibacillus humidisoli]UFJ41083.1 Crp/Fnr family transcriptional regulator [Brevibacillus humidisoli]
MSNLRYKWTPFLMYGKKLELSKNTVVYRQGERGRGFYYLDKGGLKITLLSDNGHERTIDYVPTGGLSGEHGAYKGTYLTSAITTCSSVLYFFSDEALSRVCQDHPHAAIIFTNSQIYKVRLLAEIIAFQDSPIEQQMANFLIKLTTVHENENVPIDQTSFARYIDTSRITVNKILQKWRQQGLIELSSRSKIRVVDVDRLKELVC